jgi:hypothetical protein
MPHVEETNVHRYVGDPLLLVVPVTGLAEADTNTVVFRVQGVTGIEKTLSAGITLLDGATAKTTYPTVTQLATVDDATAVLVVDVDPADISVAVGVGRWRWQLQAGGAEPQIVAHGWLAVSKRVPAPPVPVP